MTDSAKTAANTVSTRKLVALISLWWLSSAVATTATKTALTNDTTTGQGLSEFWWIWLTFFQHGIGAIIAWGCLACTGSTVTWPRQVGSLRPMLIASAGNVLANMCTNAAYSIISASGTQLIKACEPVFTIVLAYCCSNGTTKTLSSLPSTIIIVMGVVMTLSVDPTFNVTGCLLALCSNMALPIRNIFLKHDRPGWNGGSIDKFAIVSLLSTLLLLPVIILLSVQRIGQSPSDVILEHRTSVAFSVAFHCVFNLASILVLEEVSTVSHAILNILKRTFVIISSMFYFALPFSLSVPMGLAVMTIGCYMYHFKNKKMVVAKVSILLVAGLYLMYGFRNTNIQRPERILTTWMYEKPVPDEAFTGLLNIVKANPNIFADVYCGTSICMESVQKLLHLQISAHFVIAQDVFRGTPLAKWSAKQAFYKIKAGREFEMHLQHAVTLGLVWNKGGMFLSPSALMHAEKLSKETFAMSPEVQWITGGDFPLEACQLPERSDVILTASEVFLKVYDDFTFSSMFQELPLQYNKQISQVFETYAQSGGVQWHSSAIKSDAKAFLNTKKHYGTLSYSYKGQRNIGDEIQGFPGLQFLPYTDTFVHRRRLTDTADNVTLFLNAFWGGEGYAWPPPTTMDGILLSMHIAPRFKERVAQSASVAYFKEREPVGTRDLDTFAFFHSIGVDSFFSGCLTISLRNPLPQDPVSEDIFIVDVKEEFIDLLPPKVRANAILVQHYWGANEKGLTSKKDGYPKAAQLLLKYARAKVVITQRIHSALPCVGMGTPVIFFDSPGLLGDGGSKQKSTRTVGLTPLFHTIDMDNLTMEEARRTLAEFNWDQPPPNPNRELHRNLTRIQWNVIKKHRAFYDSARRFQLVPDDWLD